MSVRGLPRGRGGGANCPTDGAFHSCLMSVKYMISRHQAGVDNQVTGSMRGGGGVKPPVHFNCVLHATRREEDLLYEH